NGDVYIADGYGSSYIHQYNKDAEYIRTWGGKGTEDGKLSCPHGIWLDTRGENPEILVADRANVRLQWFSLEGEHLRTHNKDLLHPCHFDIRDGDLLVPDLFGRVSIFDKNNNLVTHLGITPGVKQIEGYPNLPHEQRHVGQFISPHSAMWDKDGNIFVVEWINDGRVT
ncbi:MAG: peptidase, partial [Candidatus Omnitrophica bacterium]|nr:peptidase [Candidatus Omnitrophota bacterium]